jgi:hypothetical protein
MIYKVLFLILLLTILYSIVNYNTKENYITNFPSKDTIKIIFDNSLYFKNLNKTDKTTRNLQKKTLMKTYYNSIVSISDRDKKIIQKTLESINNKVKNKYLNSIDWNIAVFKNIENNYPHTHGNTIFIPNNMISNIDNYKDTLLHEKVHVLQRKMPQLFDTLYISYWHMKKIQFNYKYDTRSNPDASDHWMFTYKNVNIVFIAKYKKDATNISHVHYKGVYLDLNNIAFKEKELEQIPEFIDFFGLKKSNHYHPNELSAEMMASHYFNKEPHSKAYSLFKQWLNKIE